MADNKKYYYLKLNESFFDSDEIKVLESMPNGIYYSNLLIKLYLKSLKFDGALRFNKYIPYDENMIATITNMNVDVVRSGIKVLSTMKLIERLDDGTIYLMNIQSFIGKSSSEADRKRLYREQIEEEKMMLGKISDKCPEDDGTKLDKRSREIETETETETEKETEKEIDIELEKEIELEIDKEEEAKIVSQSINLSHYYENITGLVGGLNPASLNEAVALHGPENVKMAIDRAVARSKPNMKYINGILKNWAKEGYPKEGGVKTYGAYENITKSSARRYAGFKPEEPRTLSEEERRSVENELI